ncbi:MAG: peptidoglycan-binding domain-containing protein [Candidatus Sulfotelmatobacter sp.]
MLASALAGFCVPLTVVAQDAAAAAQPSADHSESADSNRSAATSKKTQSISHAHAVAKSRHYKGKQVSSLRNRKRRTMARGQQKIDPERAQEIQQALIREHYLSGTAAGTWNQASEDAMRRYQADHGWQSKTVPDSRALISLGLGPSHDHLLNPESAMTSDPPAHSTQTASASIHAASSSTHSSAVSAPPAKTQAGRQPIPQSVSSGQTGPE